MDRPPAAASHKQKRLSTEEKLWHHLLIIIITLIIIINNNNNNFGSPTFLQFAKLKLYSNLISHIYIKEILMPDKATSLKMLCMEEIRYIGGEVRGIIFEAGIAVSLNSHDV